MIYDEKSQENGYISFTPSSIKEMIDNGGENLQAYQWLYKAMTIYEKRSGKSKALRDIYPITLDETLEMEEYLKKAEETADNPSDPTFKAKLDELKSIQDWSATPHKAFNWIVIFGGFLMLIFLWFASWMTDTHEVKLMRGSYEFVDSLIPCDEKFDIEDLNYKHEANDHTCLYKYHLLQPIARRWSHISWEHYGYLKSEVKFGSPHSKEFQHEIDSIDMLASQIKKEFDAINNLSSEEIRKLAKKDYKKHLNSAEGEYHSYVIDTILMFLLIIVYILTNLPVGYRLSRNRVKAKFTTTLYSLFYLLLAKIGLSAASAAWVDPDKILTVHYWDGSWSQYLIKSELVNWSTIWKLFLYALVLVVLAYGSYLIMLLMSVVGLIYHIDIPFIKYLWIDFKAHRKDKTEAN